MKSILFCPLSERNKSSVRSGQTFLEDRAQVQFVRWGLHHLAGPSPMLVVSRLERVIEVSMWGNIAIEETIDVVHKGAAH